MNNRKIWVIEFHSVAGWVPTWQTFFTHQAAYGFLRREHRKGHRVLAYVPEEKDDD